MTHSFAIQTHLHSALPNTADEILLQQVPLEGPQALIWQGSQGLVVPRSYSRNPLFHTACQHMAQAGWPVSLRQSGGGLVPQGPGIWNLSLAWRQYGKALDLAQEAYPFICRLLQKTLMHCGIQSAPLAVEGSFCDGRFNLAIAQPHYQKIVGTAQVWRLSPAPAAHRQVLRQPGAAAGWHVGLIHAVILLQVNEKALTLQTNLFEQLLQTQVRYESDKICSLHKLNLDPKTFLKSLQFQLRQSTPPHDAIYSSP